MAARSSGTKLKSAAKWNKTFPWGPCVARLEAVASLLGGKPCAVANDGLAVIAALDGTETVFCDPPYFDRAKYTKGGSKNLINFGSAIVASTKSRTVISETSEIDGASTWTLHDGDLLNRQAGPFIGAGKKRRELIYTNF